MKKSLFIIALFLLSQRAMPQSAEKQFALGLYFGTIQYKGEINNDFFNTGAGNYGAYGLSVAGYLSKSFDHGLMFTRGMVASENSKGQKMSGTLNNFNYFLKYKFYNGKILNENALIGPYVFAGIGYSDWSSTADGFAPVGAGFRVRISESASILMQTAYHFTGSDRYDNLTTESGNDAFLHTTLGLTIALGKSKDSDGDGVSDDNDKCPNTPAGVKVDSKGCPLDRDKDGIADYQDKCPDVAGVASAQGCPDKDGDGVADNEDKCPDIAGPAATQGCPDRDGDGVLDANDDCPDVKGLAEFRGCPDTDGDGIPDKDDKCPNEKGPKSTMGCPDRDGDSVADKDDACPDVPGIIANKGCPEVKEEVKKVLAAALVGLQFETGKDVIKKSSYATMDNVVKVMNENPSYKLSISGQTDNVGDPKMNQQLSEKRAAAAAKYLVDHGISASRLSSAGYGETMPVADNNTSEGRAKNRRVEFKIIF